MFWLQFMIEIRRPDVLTLSRTFYDLSLSRNLFSKAETRQFGAAGTEGLMGNLIVPYYIQKTQFKFWHLIQHYVWEFLFAFINKKAYENMILSNVFKSLHLASPYVGESLSVCAIRDFGDSRELGIYLLQKIRWCFHRKICGRISRFFLPNLNFAYAEPYFWSFP